MKSVAAAEASALAAWRVFHAGDRVGAIVFNDTDVTEIAPHRSRGRVTQILQAVINKNHALNAENTRAANPNMINTALSRAVRLAKHDYLVCLIAGGGGANEETVRLCSQLAAHNDVVVLFVYDPMEAALPPGGQLVFADGDVQMEVDGRDKQLEAGFSKEFQQRLEWMRHITRQQQTPLIPISTERDVAEQVRDLLGGNRR